MSEHSPGPWTCAYIGSGDWHVDDVGGKHVATVACTYNRVPHDEGKDARLIAAAPELLECLEGLLDVRDGSMAHWCATAEALIKRVRG